MVRNNGDRQRPGGRKFRNGVGLMLSMFLVGEATRCDLDLCLGFSLHKESNVLVNVL